MCDVKNGTQTAVQIRETQMGVLVQIQCPAVEDQDQLPVGEGLLVLAPIGGAQGGNGDGALPTEAADADVPALQLDMGGGEPGIEQAHGRAQKKDEQDAPGIAGNRPAEGRKAHGDQTHGVDGGGTGIGDDPFSSCL